ncbi:hypothetical protein [Gardnerella vaginalis]|uniref:Uncharacterized protein n=1 Tax=Gardnerella vaginalis TaxID=2702 RepID=A0A135Z4H5_GARVA|nr:hypothetical protein [Gardnerella vaginalis]KXI16509.1 hypothetical protein HMPREF3230_01017 [Gardnerella vaginalis]
MNMFKRIISAITLSFILTAVLTAATVIILMFTKGREMGHYLGLFGSVFFDAHETSSGSIMVGFGLQNPWILTLIFLVLFVFSLVFFTILSALQKRKKMLEALSKNKI